MELKPVKNRRIYEGIIEQVKILIAKGTLGPGDKMISEREMADRLKVGRSAVREAFRSLEAMGIVEIRQGEGTFIKEVSSQALAEMLALVLMTERNTARELLELRKILEVGSAGLAALRHTDEELRNMIAALKQMEDDLESGDLGQQADWDFHYAIAEATHNSLLILLMDSIADTMRRVLKEARLELYRTPGSPQRLLREHRTIFNAISQGWDQEAGQAMYDHLDRVGKAILK